MRAFTVHHFIVFFVTLSVVLSFLNHGTTIHRRRTVRWTSQIVNRAIEISRPSLDENEIFGDRGDRQTEPGHENNDGNFDDADDTDEEIAEKQLYEDLLNSFSSDMDEILFHKETREPRVAAVEASLREKFLRKQNVSPLLLTHPLALEESMHMLKESNATPKVLLIWWNILTKAGYEPTTEALRILLTHARVSRSQDSAVNRELVFMGTKISAKYWMPESIGAFFSLAFRIKATSQVLMILERYVFGSQSRHLEQQQISGGSIASREPEDGLKTSVLQLDSHAIVILVNGFGKLNMTKVATRIFRLYEQERLPHSDLSDAADSAIFNAYLGALLCSGHFDKAQELFQFMRDEEKLTWYTLNIMLNESIRRKDMESTRELWALASKLERDGSSASPQNECVDSESIVLAEADLDAHYHSMALEDDSIAMCGGPRGADGRHVDGARGRERHIVRGKEIFRCTLLRALLQAGADTEALELLWSHWQEQPSSQSPSCTEDEGEMIGPTHVTKNSALCTYFNGIGLMEKPYEGASQQLVQFILANYTDKLGAVEYTPEFQSVTDIDLMKLDYRPLASLLDGYVSKGRSDLALAAYIRVYDILTQITESPWGVISSESFGTMRSVPLSARPIDACGGVLAFNIMLTAVKNMVRENRYSRRRGPKRPQDVQTGGEDSLLQSCKNMDRVWEFAKDVISKRVAITLIGQGTTPINANAIEKGFTPYNKSADGGMKWKREKIVPEENVCMQNVLHESSLILNASTMYADMDEFVANVSPENATVVEFKSAEGLGWKEVAYVAATTSKRMLLDSYSVGNIIDAANSVSDFDIAKWVWINQARLRKLPNEYTVHAFLRSFTSSEDLPFLRIVLRSLFESRFKHLERTSDEILNALVRCGSANALMCGVGALLMDSQASTPSIVAIRNSLIKFDRHWRDCTINSGYINTHSNAAREVKYCQTPVKSEVYTEAIMAPTETLHDAIDAVEKSHVSSESEDFASDLLFTARNSARDIDREAIMLCDLLVARLKEDIDNLSDHEDKNAYGHDRAHDKLQVSIDTCVPSIAALVAALLSRADWGTAVYVLNSFATLTLSPTLETATKGKYGAKPNSAIRSLLVNAASRSLSLSAYSAVDASITLLMRHSEREVKNLDLRDSERGFSYMLRNFSLPEHMRHKEKHLRTVCKMDGIVEFLEFCVGQKDVADHGRDLMSLIPIPVSLLQALFVDAVAQKRYVLAARVVRILQNARLVIDCDVEGFMASSYDDDFSRVSADADSYNSFDGGNGNHGNHDANDANDCIDGDDDAHHDRRGGPSSLSTGIAGCDVNEARGFIVKKWAAQLRSSGRPLAGALAGVEVDTNVPDSITKAPKSPSSSASSKVPDTGNVNRKAARKLELDNLVKK
jgi:hypothetical protein